MENVVSVKRSHFLITLFFVLAIGTAVAFYWVRQDISWSSQFTTLIGAAAVGGGILTQIAYFSRLKYPIAVILFFLIVLTVLGFAPAAIGVIIFWLVCWSMGSAVTSLFRRLGGSADPADNIYHILIGYVITGLILTGLAYTQWNTLPSYLAIFLVPCAYGIKCYSDSGQSFSFRHDTKPRAETFHLLSVFILSTILSLLFLVSVLPDMGDDALFLYRGIMLEVLETGAFDYAPEKSSVRLLSLAGIWPQLFAVNISGMFESAKLANFSTLLMSVFVMMAVVNNLANAAFYKLALAVLLSIPVMSHITISGFYDNATVFLMVGFVFCVERMVKNGHSHSDIILLGLLCGLLVLTKYTTLFIAPVIALYFVARCYGIMSTSRIIKSGLIIGICVFLIWSSFLSFVYLQSGNPVFPYYNDKFLSEYYAPKSFSTFHTGYFSWRLLWDLMFETNTYAQAGSRTGQIGILSLIFLIPTIFVFTFGRGIEKAKRNQLILGLTCFLLALVMMSAFQNNPRYLVLLLPLLIIPLATMFELIGKALAGLLAGLMVIANLYLLPNFGWNNVEMKGVFLANHEKIIRKYKPARTVTLQLSDMYGKTGNAFYSGNLDTGFAGRSYNNSWYDYLTSVQFRHMKTKPSEKIKELLSERNLDVVVLDDKSHANFGDRILPFSRKLEKRLGIYVYYLNPNISYSKHEKIDSGSFSGVRKIYRGVNVTDISINLSFRCSGVNELRFIEADQDGQWYNSERYPTRCDGSEEFVDMTFRALDPTLIFAVQTVGSKDMELELLKGDVYTR